MTRVTLDSNIYLSALVFGGKPKRILEMAIEGEIEVAISDPIIEDVQRHLLGKFGWSEARAAVRSSPTLRRARCGSFHMFERVAPFQTDGAGAPAGTR